MDLEIQNLTKTLTEYSQSSSIAANSIANALMPFAIAVFLTLVLIDFLDFKKITDQQRIDFSNNILIELIVKWIFGAFLLFYIKDILDAIMQTSIMITNIIVDKYPPHSYSVKNVNGNWDWGLNIVMEAILYIIELIVKTIISVIIYIRYIDLYFLKALSPLIIAFYYYDATRSIVSTFLRSFIATSLISTSLLLVTIFYGFIVTDEVLAMISKGEDAETIAGLVKSIVYIFIVGSAGRRIKTLLGVN